MYVCEWGGCFGTSGSSKGPYVLLSASGTLGLAAKPRNKAVCSFPGRPVNKCLSQGPWPMGGERKGGKARVLVCACVLWGVDWYRKHDYIIQSVPWLFLYSLFRITIFIFGCSFCLPLRTCSVIIPPMCHLLHNTRYTVCHCSGSKAQLWCTKEPWGMEGWSRWRERSKCLQSALSAILCSYGYVFMFFCVCVRLQASACDSMTLLMEKLDHLSDGIHDVQSPNCCCSDVAGPDREKKSLTVSGIHLIKPVLYRGCCTKTITK